MNGDSGQLYDHDDRQHVISTCSVFTCVSTVAWRLAPLTGVPLRWTCRTSIDVTSNNDGNSLSGSEGFVPRTKIKNSKKIRQQASLDANHQRKKNKIEWTSPLMA
jgi:hypothetical protein